MAKNKYREKEIPKYKKEAVTDLAEQMKKNSSTVIVSIKNVPAKQLQLIKKQMRGKAKMRVVKKSIANRAIEKTGNKKIKKLEGHLRENISFLFSDLDPFEVSSILAKNKSKARAKEGQEVNEEVVVEAGPTEMTPGPVISRLGDLGIQFEIKEGKINIKERKKILDEGEEAGPGETAIMTKLEIKPIEVSLRPLVAYYSENNKVYEDIEINIEEVVEQLKDRFNKIRAFAVEIGYSCKETIGFILAKAASHEQALEKHIENNDKSESDDKKEEKKEDESRKRESNDKVSGSESKKGSKGGESRDEKSGNSKGEGKKSGGDNEGKSDGQSEGKEDEHSKNKQSDEDSDKKEKSGKTKQNKSKEE